VTSVGVWCCRKPRCTRLSLAEVARYADDEGQAKADYFTGDNYIASMLGQAGRYERRPQRALLEAFLEVRAVAFAPDGKTLATGSWDRAVKLWDVASGKEIRTLEGYKDRIFGVTFSPDGQALIATGYGREAPVWDLRTGQVIHIFSHGGFAALRTAVFTPDGRWLLTGGYDGTVRVWNARTAEMRCQFKNLGGVDGLAYAPATRTLAIGGIGKSIQLFELSLNEPTPKERERIRTLLDKLDEDAYGTREDASKELLQVGLVAEPELRRAAKESPSAEVRIRARRIRTAMLSQPRATLNDHTDRVEDIAFSSDGRFLASASKDGTLRLWDIWLVQGAVAADGWGE
jgi:WD40 repeat protein